MATASPSSAPERRGQASPTAALVAVAAVGLGLSLYATVFAGVAPTADRNVAEPTLSRVHDAVAPAGVADPDRLDGAAGENAAGAGEAGASEAGMVPEGWSLAVELRTDTERWSAGDFPASTAGNGGQSAGRRVPVRVAPGDVRSGWLRVVVRR